ncbi:MAG: ABC transporter permease subunit [Candidatus Gracilibacteria bacterium]
MNTIIIIAIKEFKEIIRTRTFLFVLFLFLVLVGISITISSLVFNDQVTQFNQSLEVLKSLGRASNITQPDFYPLNLLRGVVDYIEIVGAILGIFLGYISAYREKVSKSLSLILSRPVKKIHIIYGKLLGNFSFIFMMMIFVSILIITLLYAIAGANLIGVEFIKIGLFVFTSSFYILIFFMLSFLLCLSQKNTVNALIMSFLIWLIFALIIPQIGDTMDTDNQISGGFFKSINLSRTDEFKVMDHFKTYENIRTGVEQLSITKHYERLEFALFGIKKDYADKSLSFILQDKSTDIFILIIFFGLLMKINTYYLKKNLNYN